MILTADPEKDDMTYQAWLESLRKNSPVCRNCGEKIIGEVYCDDDGFYCEPCLLEKYHVKETDL